MDGSINEPNKCYVTNGWGGKWFNTSILHMLRTIIVVPVTCNLHYCWLQLCNWIFYLFGLHMLRTSSLVSLKYKWCSFSCSSIIDRKPHNITSSRWKMVPYQPKYVVSNYKQKSGTERELINHTIWLIKGCKCNNLKAVPLLCNIQTFSSSIYSRRGSRAVKVHSCICFLLSLTHFSNICQNTLHNKQIVVSYCSDQNKHAEVENSCVVPKPYLTLVSNF